jgi:hypothetical protein
MAGLATVQLAKLEGPNSRKIGAMYEENHREEDHNATCRSARESDWMLRELTEWKFGDEGNRLKARSRVVTL